jgi:hypothetical protein
MSQPTEIRPGKIYRTHQPIRDDEYRRFIKSLPCVGCLKTWWVDPAHTGPHGIGQKACDLTCIPRSIQTENTMTIYDGAGTKPQPAIRSNGQSRSVPVQNMPAPRKSLSRRKRKGREDTWGYPEVQEAPVASVTPIRKPSKRQPTPEPQPRLFDHRGTGTHGPAPLAQQIAAVAPAIQTEPARYVKPQPIPWNVAFREVSAFVKAELVANNLQWSDASQQGMVSTVLIAASKAGMVGLWERGK